MNEFEHDWCSQQLATYLADGLADEERSRFEAHVRECEICAHDLDDARGIESNLKDLFAEVSPAEDFGDRMVGRLRQVGLRRRVHPMVRRVAVAAAAAIVMGGLGYVGNTYFTEGRLPDLLAIGDRYYSARQAAMSPPAAASEPEGWNFGGGGHTNQDWASSRIPVGTAVSVAGGLSVSGGTFTPHSNSPAAWRIDAGQADSEAQRREVDGKLMSGAGSASFTRVASVNGGTLQVGTIAYTGGGTIYGSPAHSAGSLTVTNGITNTGGGSAALVYSGSRTATSDLPSGDSGGFSKTGTGSLQLRSGRARSSELKEGAGSWVFNGPGAWTLGRDTSVVTNSSSQSFSIIGGGSSGFASNAGTVSSVPAATGVITLGGALSYSGNTTVSTGTLKVTQPPTFNIQGVNQSGNGGGNLFGNVGQNSPSPNTNNTGVTFDVSQSFKPGQYGLVVDGTVAGTGGVAKVPVLGDVAYVGEAFRRQSGTEQNDQADDRLRLRRGQEQLGQQQVASSMDTRQRAFNSAEWTKDDSSGMQPGAANSVTFGAIPTAQPPSIGENGQPTAIVQAFIQQPPFGPNPTAAIERTELALANTMQQQPATQPSQGGAVVVAQAQPAPQQPAQPAPAPMMQVRRVIRDGVMEFEVDSFDSSFAVVSKITGEEGGFIVAADSDRLQNGKVRGTITVRVPPDNLDTLILKLRALGELKSQKLGSKDISKEYTDLESELRAGKAMEERLLEMIKTAQGEVKDLLEAEKELANWRIRLEKVQGQMNYYNNLVSLATLTINAYEKDIRTPASATQTEEINAGIEAEDVDGARSAALKAIEDAKGRIVESALQQMNAGQFAAKIVADVAPESTGQVVDRLRQIGRVARLDSQKKQTTGTGQTPTQGTSSPGVLPKVEQAPTRLLISIYNLANVAPRLTTNLNLAGDDVETVYRAILKRVTDANGRVVSSNLNRQDANQITGTIQFEVKSADADAVLNDIRQPVQVLRLNVTENPDTANVTSTKQGFTVQIIPTAQVTPRLTTNLNLAAEDVEATYSSILNRIRETGGRVITSNLNRQDATQAVGTIQFEVKSTEADALLNELRTKVQILTLNVTENTGAANVTGLKQGFSMQIIPTAQVNPREVRSLAVQTGEVDEAIQKVTSAAVSAGGRVLESSMSQDEGGSMIARIVLEVPLDKLEGVTDIAKVQGKVRTAEASRNTQVPEGPLSRARINLTIGTGDTIVPQTGGFWDTIRGGLSTSVKGLLWSLQLIIIGLCLVGPWVLMVWGGVKWAKRRSVKARSSDSAVPA